MTHAEPNIEHKGVTRRQWWALTAAWLGWAFDGLDGYLYVMVATRFVGQLLGPDATPAQITEKASLIQAAFLVGWAVGGAFFGRVGDRIGRSRTLTITILTYALFTGLAFFATEWWHLLIFRFIAALGIGGEWAAGSALVSETLHVKHRAWASATLQSGYMVGCILAALTAGWMSHLDPKWVFVVGITPALLTFWIRFAVPETDEWTHHNKHSVPPPLSSLFSRELLRTTILTVALTGIALTTVWALLYFGPQAIKSIPEIKEWSPAQQQKFVTNVTVAYLLVNIAGNYFATYLAQWIGYRKAFTFLFAASLATYMLLFREPLTLSNVYWVMGTAAFFSLGLFGLFPLYIPPLFPTLTRTLGAGFTYNAGRLISAAGALFGGLLATSAGGNHRVIFWTALLYIPGMA
ncbi:MAG: MFS transporter [Planctomycetota bacterium]|nr:MFS transporter [Planctomycetota bacterium]